MSRLAHPEDYSPGEFGLPHMGEVIANHRKKAGWNSQDDFAIVCGVDKQTVVYWEKQVYLADMNRRIFLCKLLKIPPGLLGLTWPSLRAEEETKFPHVMAMSEMLQENAYALYEDVLIFAHTSTDKYSPAAAYRFYKHQQELEQIVKQAPEIEKDAWKDLLSRFYQHSTFIAQHHKQDEQALSLANEAVNIAVSLNDTELVGASLYRRSRVHLIQNRYDAAKKDIQESLDKAERARGQLKGSSYLLAAEINALYAEGDEKLKAQCRKWQDDAAKLIYKGKVEEDGTFLTFNLYAIHHERAKTLLRFALHYTTDNELATQLKRKHVRADKELIKDAKGALITARKHLESTGKRKEMYLSITEARIHLVAREFEECARVAKQALQSARKAHSQQGIEEIKQIYAILHQLDARNPHVAHLGVELGIFPT
jgi:DNA-binding XRE family transcriptional regulator/predicted transcriptional regulator